MKRHLFFWFVGLCLSLCPWLLRAAVPDDLGTPTMALFLPLLQAQDLSCDDVARVQNLAELTYPNPYFLKRIAALSKIKRCHQEELSASEVRSLLNQVPARFYALSHGTWLCAWKDSETVKNAPWEWVDLVAQRAQSEPKGCLPQGTSWIFTLLKKYHERDYASFEALAFKKQNKWAYEVESRLRPWMWNRLVLSAKRRGDRQTVLQYYRRWTQVLKSVPEDHPEKLEAHLWLLRWEALLGQPSRTRHIVSRFKKQCGTSKGIPSALCAEFTQVWLSRYWYEGKDQGLEWIKNAALREKALWWVAQKNLAQKNLAKAKGTLVKLEKTKSERQGHGQAIPFWKTWIAAQAKPAPSKKSVWSSYLNERPGSRDFYSYYALAASGRGQDLAVKLPGPSSSSILDSAPVEVSAAPSSKCTPFLEPLWGQIEKHGAEFIIEDDVKWYANHVRDQPQCQQKLQNYRDVLMKYCVSEPLIRSGEIPYRSTFYESAKRFKISPALLMGLAKQESAFCTQAVSWADAMGLMQLQWNKRLHQSGLLTRPDELFIPDLNLQVGAWELRRLHKKFNQNWILTLAAYNAGEDVVRKWIQDRPHSSTLQFMELIPFAETRNYVRRVYSNWIQFDMMDHQGHDSGQALRQLAGL